MKRVTLFNNHPLEPLPGRQEQLIITGSYSVQILIIFAYCSTKWSFFFRLMDRGKVLSVIEIALSSALFIAVLYGIGVRYLEGPEAFRHYVREDGPVEYATAFFLFAGSLVALCRAVTCCRGKRHLPILTWSVLAFLFFFAAGDEISWGQRILNIDSGEFFLKHNKQEEINIHNLVVAGKNLNIIIFSRLVIIALLFYFIVIPLLVRKEGFIRNLVTKFGLPLPSLRHIIIMGVSTVMIAVISMAKGSELNELAFSVIFFMIFMNPVIFSHE